jgi:hypothetical protein
MLELLCQIQRGTVACDDLNDTHEPVVALHRLTVTENPETDLQKSRPGLCVETGESERDVEETPRNHQ